MIEGKRKGSKVYCSNGYNYIKNNEYNGRMNLRCQIYRKNCPGTASIENGKFFENRSHCHDGDSKSIQNLKIEAKIKQDSEKTPLAPRDIYNYHVEDSNAQISPYPNLSSTMRKRRAKTFPPVPKTLPEFDQILRENEDLGHLEGKIFSRTFASSLGEYALLFSTDIPDDLIGKVKDVHCDATFKTVPSCFYQLLIMHGVILDTIVPLFYFLMTGKSRMLYDAICRRAISSIY